MKVKLSAAWKRGREFVVDHRAGVLRGALGIGIGLIVLLIHRATYDILRSQPEFQVKPLARVQVAPMWGAGESTVEMPVDLSLFDDSVVARVGKSFEANPWVKRVTAVERVFPDRLRVRFEARRPHVALRRPDGVYVVDAEGVVLPGVYASIPASCARTIEVTGVASLPPRAGGKWDDADVRAGMELVELVASTATLTALDVRTIDVSNVGGRIDRRRPDTSLVTASGCTIVWGRAPSAAGFGEPTPSEKLELLGTVVREYPKLDGLNYVKIHAGGKAAVSKASPETQAGGPRTRR